MVEETEMHESWGTVPLFDLYTLVWVFWKKLSKDRSGARSWRPIVWKVQRLEVDPHVRGASTKRGRFTPITQTSNGGWSKKELDVLEVHQAVAPWAAHLQESKQLGCRDFINQRALAVPPGKDSGNETLYMPLMSENCDHGPSKNPWVCIPRNKSRKVNAN